MGVVVYADDILLMAPTRGSMQMVLEKCQTNAAEHNIMFSTDPNPSKSKTKCIFVCGSRKNLVKPAPLTLCGRELPWVAIATHLGHELHETGTMEHDALAKQAIFIDNSLEIREAFAFASRVKSCQLSRSTVAHLMAVCYGILVEKVPARSSTLGLQV